METGYWLEESYKEEKTFDFMEGEDTIFWNDSISPRIIYSFLHGYCNVFAKELSRRTNKPIAGIFTACGKILIHAFVIDITDNTYIDVRGKQSDLSKFIEDFDLTLDDLEIDDPNDNGQIFLKQFESLDEFEKYMPTNAPEIVSKEADNILNDRLAASIYGNLK